MRSGSRQPKHCSKQNNREYGKRLLTSLNKWTCNRTDKRLQPCPCLRVTRFYIDIINERT
jgi:hypothetical protein